MEEALRLSNRLFHCRLNYYKEGILLSKHVDEIISRHLSIRPFHLNVIEAACRGRFKETGHSLVLADLLKHPIIQSSFIERFLNIQHEFMDVTAEKDRVDVALKGKDIFVIVENKVNAADEQKNQVYRYVHEIGIKKYGFMSYILIPAIVLLLQHIHCVTKIMKITYSKHLVRSIIQYNHINMILLIGYEN